MKSKSTTNDAYAKLHWGERIAYGCGHGGGGVILNVLIQSFMLAYYTDTMLIGASAIAAMFLLMRVLDGVTDVIFGSIVDKTNTRWGKARPWILVSAITIPASIIASFWAPQLGEHAKIVYAYITYFLSSCIAYTIFNIADYALLARMTRNDEERTTCSTVMMVINNIVTVIIGAVIAPMVSKIGWRYTSIILGIAAFAFLMYEFLFTRERVGATIGEEEEDIPVKVALKSVAKNKYFWLLAIFETLLCIVVVNVGQAAVFYCNWVLKDPMYISSILSIGTLPSIAVLFLIPLLAKKFSKSAQMIFFSFVMLVGYVLGGIAGENHMLVMLSVMLRLVGSSPLFAVPAAMVGDISDYNEWKTGVRSSGMCSMGMSVGGKIGMGVGAAITGWVLAGAGYNAQAATQSAAVITGIKFSFGWINAILTVILIIIAWKMDIHKYMPQVQKDLEARRAK